MGATMTKVYPMTGDETEFWTEVYKIVMKSEARSTTRSWDESQGICAWAADAAVLSLRERLAKNAGGPYRSGEEP